MIKARRIKYLHYLLTSPPGEMLTNVFKAQMRNTMKGDWVEIVKKDLEDFGIKETFEEIAKKKEKAFKKDVTNACKVYSFNKLLKEKEKRSKGENLIYKKFEMQSYLLNKNFKSRDATFLFKIRTEMIEVRKNYEHQFKNNMTCPVCHSHTDTQQSILTCSALNLQPNQTKYSELFSNDLKVVEPALKSYQSLWRKREKMLLKK